MTYLVIVAYIRRIKMYKKQCDEIKLHEVEEYTKHKPISEHLAEWGYYSETDKYCCFMHDDLYPSMFVDDANGVFYCHSCGNGGGTGKLIYLYYKQQYGIKTYLEGLELYLEMNPEARQELGFSSIYDSTIVVSQESLEDIVSSMDKLQEVFCQVSEINLDYKPTLIFSKPDEILDYCSKIQNEIRIS